MLTRRNFLWHAGGGLGGIALAHLLAAESGAPPPPGLNGGIHHRARARRVIQLFMNGGASQVDTFDYKPLLNRRHGEVFRPGGAHVEAVTSTPGAVLGSPFSFQRHGESGRWVSSVFPRLARHVDDMAFVLN